MRSTVIVACAMLLTQSTQAPPTAPAVPDLSGVWDGTRRAHPTNSATVPWARTVAEGTILPDGMPAGRDSVVSTKEGDGALLARRRAVEGDGHRRRSDVPEEPGVVHDAMVAGAKGVQAESLRLRSGSGTAVGAVHTAEVQMKGFLMTRAL